MAFSMIAHVEAHPGSGGGTSSSVDTSGANTIVIAVAAGSSVTVSDSKGNAYNPSPQVSTGSIRQQFFRCDAPVVGSGHTFTVTGTAVYPCFHVLAFSGAKSFPAIQFSSGASSGTSQSTGSITPPADNYLLITATAVGGSSSGEAADSPFSSNSYFQNFSGGVNYGGGIAYEIQTTATARNPTWSGSSVARAVAILSIEVSSAYSGWTPIARVQAGLGSTGGTTSAIDTTGADFILIAVAKYQSTAVTISDSKSNGSPTALTEYGSNDRVRLYYYAAPSVGSGHTFTINGPYPGVQIIAFSGSHASPYDQTNGAYSTNSSSQAAGSLTPSEDNCLVVTAVGLGGGSVTEQVDSPFSAHQYFIDVIAGTNQGCGIAYEVQTTATARNPTWTGTATGSGRDRSATIATFKKAAGGGGGGQPTVKRWGGVKFSGAGIQGVW